MMVDIDEHILWLIMVNSGQCREMSSELPLGCANISQHEASIRMNASLEAQLRVAVGCCGSRAHPERLWTHPSTSKCWDGFTAPFGWWNSGPTVTDNAARLSTGTSKPAEFASPWIWQVASPHTTNHNTNKPCCCIPALWLANRYLWIWCFYPRLTCSWSRILHNGWPIVINNPLMGYLLLLYILRSRWPIVAILLAFNGYPTITTLT